MHDACHILSRLPPTFLYFTSKSFEALNSHSYEDEDASKSFHPHWVEFVHLISVFSQDFAIIIFVLKFYVTRHFAIMLVLNTAYVSDKYTLASSTNIGCIVNIGKSIRFKSVFLLNYLIEYSKQFWRQC